MIRIIVFGVFLISEFCRLKYFRYVKINVIRINPIIGKFTTNPTL